MPEEKNESTSNDDIDAEAMKENNSCGDMTLVTEGEFLEDDDIVELTNKEEYIDEP